MHVEIREFQETDRPVLSQVFAESRKAAFPWIPRAQLDLIDFTAATAGERILVALLDDQPVGFAAIWEADSFLHHLFVAPTHFGHGIGTALLATCNRYFRDRPSLKCLLANRPALKFYAARGWQETARGESEDGPYVLLRPRMST